MKSASRLQTLKYQGLRLRHRLSTPGAARLLVACLLCFGAASLPGAFAQTPSSFMTPEFNANWGLGVINAQDAYALGFTGKGVRLGIADDAFQFTHPEFRGRIFSPTTYPLFPLPGVKVPTHGTHVMGLAAAARNGNGMMGVAFDASLAGVVAYDTAGYPKAGDWAAELINAKVSVMNGSFGPDAAPSPTLADGSENPNYSVVNFLAVSSSELVDGYDAIKRLSAADIVMVFAAGNEFEEQPLASRIPSGIPMIPLVTPANTAAGTLYRVITDESDSNNPGAWSYVPITNPELAGFDASAYQGALIAVVALDKNNQIADFSNRCGAAASWCMAAPGVDLWSTVPMNTYSNSSGTSMAAPLVAGSAAVVRQAFPYMTARQVIEVLLTTATDLGDRSVFGHGLLNLGRAVKGPIKFGSDPIFSTIFAVDTKGYHSTWSNDISGAGGLSKSGAGVLRLTGQNTYTGDTTVLGGTLRVDGSIASSDLVVERGAILSGTGVVGDTVVRGTVAPGNSVGKLTVNGDYEQQAGSTYVLEIQDRTRSDSLVVTGAVTLEDGASLVVNPMDRLALDFEYHIMTVGGSLTGSFTEVETDFVFLNEVVAQALDVNGALDFEVTRNSVEMASFAQSGNQAAVARAIDSQFPGAEPFDSFMIVTDSTALAGMYQELSGEIYASNQAVILNNSRLVSQSINGRIQDSWLSDPYAGRQDGLARINNETTAWTEIYGNWDRLAGSQNATSVSANGAGILMGVDHAVSESFRLGGALGFTQLWANASNSKASTQAYHLALYGTGSVGAFRTSGGITQSFFESGVSRTLPAGIDSPVGSSASGNLSGRATQLFAEMGLPMRIDPLNEVQPFVNVSQTWLQMGSFNETGSVAALRGNSSHASTAFSTVGVRWQRSWQVKDVKWQVSAMAGWQHGWGDLSPKTTLAFSTGDSFNVYSAPLARNGVAFELGVGAQIGPSSRLLFVYAGSFGGGTSTQSLQAQLRWTF